MIFTNTVKPLSFNFNKTKVGTKRVAVTGSEYVRYNNLYIEWNKEALFHLIAKKYNLKHIYYADVKTFNIVGVYNKKTYYFYGD